VALNQHQAITNITKHSISSGLSVVKSGNSY